MKNALLASFFMALVLLCAGVLAAGKPETTLTIEGHYSYNKEIYGTYRQVQEKLHYRRGKRRKTQKAAFTTGDLVIKNGQVYFVRPVVSRGKVEFVTFSLPYKKKGKRHFELQTEANIDQLKDLYTPELNQLLKTQGLDPAYVNLEFKTASCRGSHGKLTCKFPVKAISNK